jgi:hypothetical protein
MVLVDVSDPTDPAVLSSVQLPGPYFNDIVIHGPHAFVSAWDHGVQIVDVSDSVQPLLVASASGPGSPGSIAVADGILYTGMGVFGMAVHGIGDPSHPVPLGILPVHHGARGIGVYAGYVYLSVTGNPNGLQVCFPQCPVPTSSYGPPGDGGPDWPPAILPSTRISGVAPNPFNPRTTIGFVVDRPQRISLGIYDPAGRLVARPAQGVFASGEHRVNWNGRNLSGAECASGVYLLRLEGQSAPDVRKVLLMR